MTKFVVIAIPFLLCAAGCSEKGPRRFEVSGTVTLDGKPVKFGILTLVPAPNTMGPSSGATIEDGKFSVPKEKGPIEGEYIFQFTGRSDTPSGKYFEDSMGNKNPIMAPVFPDRYGYDSKEVHKIGRDSHHFDFNFTTN